MAVRFVEIVIVFTMDCGLWTMDCGLSSIDFYLLFKKTLLRQIIQA